MLCTGLEVHASTAAWVSGHTQLPELLQRAWGGEDAIFHFLLFLCEVYDSQMLSKEPWKVLSRAIKHSK